MNAEVLKETAQILSLGEPDASTAFLQAPGLWPRFPLCPVKRLQENENELTLGVVACRPTSGKVVPCVFEINLLLVGSRDAWDRCPKHTYDSISALTADGWRVD